MTLFSVHNIYIDKPAQTIYYNIDRMKIKWENTENFLRAEDKTKLK